MILYARVNFIFIYSILNRGQKLRISIKQNSLENFLHRREFYLKQRRESRIDMNLKNLSRRSLCSPNCSTAASRHSSSGNELEEPGRCFFVIKNLMKKMQPKIGHFLKHVLTHLCRSMRFCCILYVYAALYLIQYSERHRTGTRTNPQMVIRLAGLQLKMLWERKRNTQACFSDGFSSKRDYESRIGCLRKRAAD